MLPFAADASPAIGETKTRISGEDGGYDPAISADGRVIAFISNAPGQSVFVHDHKDGTTELIAVGPGDVSISGDGRYVVFPGNGLAGDATVFEDIFVYDRQTAIIELVSIATDGIPGNDYSLQNEWGAVSADGRFVVFHSAASNLAPEDDNGIPDVFVHDRQTRTTTRVSTAATYGGLEASISGNGRYVAFRDWNSDCFVYDLQTGVTEPIGGTCDSLMTGLWQKSFRVNRL
jgi:Tol biopolymer transport system component